MTAPALGRRLTAPAGQPAGAVVAGGTVWLTGQAARLARSAALPG
jgi:hypothetical protein